MIIGSVFQAEEKFINNKRSLRHDCGGSDRVVRMAGDADLQKLDGKIGLFTIHTSINVNSEEACENINNTMDELEKEGYVKYIFDLQHLNLANSRFIGLVAKRHYSLSQKGGQVVILKTQDMVHRSFEMSGLLDMLQFHTDQEEAVKSLTD